MNTYYLIKTAAKVRRKGKRGKRKVKNRSFFPKNAPNTLSVCQKAMPLEKVGCILSQKNKKNLLFILSCLKFALPLHSLTKKGIALAG